ncbi:hypothetical protein LEN26_000051 [Aphanomyces euteiches]|nr:hypothetical protein AeMF1_000332 [Aphanomyces euteiches]KAH9164416.1 hypothetical protein LEN26_000051 [Aphanomyces euteiches]
MALEGVSRQVRNNVSNYYKHHWTQSTEQQTLAVLKPLPDNLRQEIQAFLHEKSVSHMTVFRVVDAEGLRFIYSIMKHQSYKRGEFVVRVGDTGDNIYILTRGILEACQIVDDFLIPSQLMYPGHCVGESAFVLKRQHEISARVASESADVSVLSRQDFITIVEHFEHLWPKVEELANTLASSERNRLRIFDLNLRKANIYRTLNQAATIYIEPKLDDFLIHPTSNRYRVWELVITMVVVYNFVQITFRVSMCPEPSDLAMLVFSVVDIICDIIYLVDMYIKYNHLIIMDKNGDEVVSVAMIRANYIRGALKIEAMSSMPLYYIGNYKIMTLCRLPRLLRCYQLSDLLHSFHTFVQEQTSSVTVSEGLELVKLLIMLVLSSHLAATCLYLISFTEYSHHYAESDENATTEVHELEIWFEHDFVIHHHPHDLGTVYLRAIYWGLGVLSSFDYMDIEMSMIGETLWFCVVALVGVVFIGLIIGQLSNSIFNANKTIREVEMKLENFAFYARKKHLPAYLVRRARLFFRFQLDCNLGMDSHEIFCNLPQSLRLEVFKDLHTKLLSSIPLFSTLTSAQMSSIAEKLHSQLYLPGDNIIMEGDVGNALYIMKHGLGEKFLRAHRLAFAPVYEGSLFGEFAFFLSMRYTHCVRAVKCSEILCISKQAWMEAWSNEAGFKFKVKLAVAVQREFKTMERVTSSIKQNFGITGNAPIKLNSMLGIVKARSPGMKRASDTRRDSIINIFENLRELARYGRKIPHFSQQGAKTLSIWSFGPPPRDIWMPESLFRQIWDIAMFGITIYYVTALPFRACFVQIPASTPVWIIVWFACDYAMDILSLVDFYLRYQVFYIFKEGEIQTNQTVLRKHYCQQGQFICDVVATIPFELFSLGYANSWQWASLFRLNRMIRLLHLAHLSDSLGQYLSRWEWFHSKTIIFQYIMYFIAPFFLMAHWIACIWFYLSFITRKSETPSWLVSTGYVDIDVSDISYLEIPIEFSDEIRLTSLNLYLVSLYYATSSLTSQSFGDVVSRNSLETWLTVGIMVFSIAFYGVLVGVLSEMMQDRLNPRAKFEQHMVDISTFFNYRLLPFDFFIQTSRYCRTQWQTHMGRTEEDFLSVLSSTIREDIAMHVKQSVISHLSFLDNCEEAFVRALVVKLRTEEFIHADVVYQFGDVARVLYIIDVGTVSLVSCLAETQIRRAHDFFGGVSLFEDNGRSATAIANEESTMFLLHHQDFQRLVDRFPEYYDRCYNLWNVSDEDPCARSAANNVRAQRRITKNSEQNG